MTKRVILAYSGGLERAAGMLAQPTAHFRSAAAQAGVVQLHFGHLRAVALVHQPHRQAKAPMQALGEFARQPGHLVRGAVGVGGQAHQIGRAHV